MGNKKIIERVPAQTPLDWLAIVWATGFGSGYSPVAPGTAGTIVAIPIYLLLIAYLKITLPLYLLIVLVVIGTGSLAAQRAGKHFGIIDAGHIVVDEIAGFLLTMVAAPVTWPSVLIGFTLFRVFDIVKPWPANYFDRQVANGFGVVMDDVAAGLYACLCLQLLKLANVL